MRQLIRHRAVVDGSVHGQGVAEERQFIQRNRVRKGDKFRQRPAVRAAFLHRFLLGRRFGKRRMFDKGDMIVRTHRDHTNRVAVRSQNRFNIQSAHAVDDFDFHAAAQCLCCRQLLRRHRVQRVHARVRIARRDAQRHTQVHAALIRARNTHAHGVFEQVRIQPRRHLRDSPLRRLARRRRVEGNCRRFRTAG